MHLEKIQLKKSKLGLNSALRFVRKRDEVGGDRRISLTSSQNGHPLDAALMMTR